MKVSPSWRFTFWRRFLSSVPAQQYGILCSKRRKVNCKALQQVCIWIFRMTRTCWRRKSHRIKVDMQGEATCCSAPVRPAGQHSHHPVTSAARFISMHVPFICLAISNNGGFTGVLTLQHWYKSWGYDAGLRTATECLRWSANVFHRCSKSPFSSSRHPVSLVSRVLADFNSPFVLSWFYARSVSGVRGWTLFFVLSSTR